jgi:predicted DNA-binding WGR domain protein
MRFEKKSVYLEHSGGTKFYEMVMLTAKSTGKSMLIRRWGKIADFEKGVGAIKVENFADETFCEKQFHEIRNDKCRSSIKGQYKAVSSNFGFHRLTTELIAFTLIDVAYQNYSNKVDREIVKKFVDENGGMSPVVKKVVEVNRDENWGSW